MKSEKMWNQLARNWDTPGVSLGENDLKIIERMKKYLNDGSLVLDYGCATGSIALEIASMAKEVRGIDISANMIEIATRKADERGVKNIAFTKATVFNESLRKESFDVILSLSILHLVEDSAQVMGRINQLLKPGGIFISATPCLGEKTFLSVLMNIPIFLLSRVGVIPSITFFSASSLSAAITNADFQMIEQKDLSVRPLRECFIVARKAWKNIKNVQKIGGIAALGHTAALVVGMVLSFTVMFPLLDAAPDQAQKFLSDNQALVHLWTLIVDWGSAITLVIMLLALYERLKPGAPALMQAAVFFGFLWAGLTIGTGSLTLHNFGVVANLHGSVPAQAAAWTALARSLWVLLLSLAVLRKGGLTRATGYLGVFLGIVGILTMIPSLAEIMFMIFGPGMMIWSAWVGIVMLRRSAAITAQHDDTFMPRHST